jgi:hypothetical protein
MSGKSGKSNGCGGRGRNERSGRGRGRGHSYTGTSKTQKSGLCKTLENNVFDYGHKAAADQMRTSNEKQYVGTTYGQEISNELHNKTTLVLPEPVHTAAVLTRHATRELMIRKGQANLQQARKAQKVILQAAVTQANEPEAPLKLSILENAIAEGDFEQSGGTDRTDGLRENTT